MRRDKVDFSTGLLDIEATVVVAERERQIAHQPPEKVAPRVGSGLQNVDHPPTVGGTTASESPTSSASQVPGTFTWRSRVDHRCLPFSTIYGRPVPAMGEVIPCSWTLGPSAAPSPSVRLTLIRLLSPEMEPHTLPRLRVPGIRLRPRLVDHRVALRP